MIQTQSPLQNQKNAKAETQRAHLREPLKVPVRTEAQAWGAAKTGHPEAVEILIMATKGVHLAPPMPLLLPQELTEAQAAWARAMTIMVREEPEITTARAEVDLALAVTALPCPEVRAVRVVPVHPAALIPDTPLKEGVAMAATQEVVKALTHEHSG